MLGHTSTPIQILTLQMTGSAIADHGLLLMGSSVPNSQDVLYLHLLDTVL